MDKFRELFTCFSDTIQKHQQQRMEMEELILSNSNHIAIFGCGNLGTHLAERLNSIYSIKDVSFIDTYKKTDTTRNLYNIKDIKDYIPTTTLIVITMYTVLDEMCLIQDKLNQLGYYNIISVSKLRFLPKVMQYGLISYDLSNIKIDAICDVYNSLYDNKSKATYYNVFNYILSGEDLELMTTETRLQYMPSDIYQVINNERIVDCGAFDGDTMRSFWKALSPYGFDSYIAVEPDFKNRERLSRSIEVDIPQHAQNRVRIIPAAVSNQSGEILFNNTGTSSSAKTSNTEGAISVPVVRLNDVIDSAVTLIKMDIEGFELLALQGAEQIIKKYQPLMAVCGYHRFEDLWEIPLYLHKLLPDHEIVFRNYVGLIEYVFYAIPKERILK